MDSHGDAIRSDELLAQLGWVRALARNLVADSDVTDDVLQQVCLLALQKAPPEAGTGPRLRAWLTTVTRRLAQHASRAEARRQRREHAVARPEALPSTADVVVQREALRGLIEAVTALQEPYYSAVVARYFEGRAVREIAAHWGISTDAVEQRLSRARRQLRARLQTLVAADGQERLRAALTLAPASTAARGTSAKAFLAHIGGVLVAKSVPAVATAICVALVITGTVLYLGSDDRSAPHAPVVDHVPQNSPEPTPAAAPGLPEFESAEPLLVENRPQAAEAEVAVQHSATQPQTTDKPTAELRVLVVDPRGRVVERAEVLSDRGEPRRQITNAEGLALIAGPPGEPLRLAARHEDFRMANAGATLASEPGGVTDVRMQLAKGLQICLEVRTRDGRPIADACVRLREGAHSSDTKDNLIGPPESLQLTDDYHRLGGEVQETRATDSQGRCCVNGVVSGPITIHVDARGYVPLRGTAFDVDADGGDLGVVVLDPAVALGGYVGDAAGPVPGALIEVHALNYWRTTTAEDGSFSVDWLPTVPTRVSLLVAHPERGHFYDDRMILTAEPVRVRLVPDVDVRLELLDAQTHAPVDGEGELTRQMPESGFISVYSHHRERVAVVAGRLDVHGLAYYLEGLKLEVGDYDPLIVPMSSITAEADHVLELELLRPVLVLVRVRAAGSGELITGAQLNVGLREKDSTGRVLPSFFMLEQARFDAHAGGYVVSESDLRIASQAEISLWVSAEGFAPSALVPIAIAGRRTSATTIDVYLEPEPSKP
jgi:RNA polymerase sigma factor (sigma-70 family)